MDGFAVTVRLLDPPLHEFIPREKAQQEVIAKSLNISLDEFKKEQTFFMKVIR